MTFEAVTLFEGDFLDEALEFGIYRLQKGCEDEIIEPIEACERLYVVTEGKILAVINDYSDLSLYIERIGSIEQAERFIRLPTSLHTFHLFRRGKIEIDCRFVAQYRAPALAQIDEEDADRLNLHPIQVTEMEGGYRVERFLYVWEQTKDDPLLQEVVEIVGLDGSYTRIAERLITGMDTRGIALPIFE